MAIDVKKREGYEYIEIARKKLRLGDRNDGDAWHAIAMWLADELALADFQRKRAYRHLAELEMEYGLTDTEPERAESDNENNA